MWAANSYWKLSCIVNTDLPSGRLKTVPKHFQTAYKDNNRKRKTGRPYGTACLFMLHVGYALFPHFYIAFVYLALSVCSYVVQCNVKADCLASTIIITSLTKILNCRYILFRGGLNVKFDFFTRFKHSPLLKNKKSCNCYFVASSRLKRTSMRILLVLLLLLPIRQVWAEMRYAY